MSSGSCGLWDIENVQVPNGRNGSSVVDILEHVANNLGYQFYAGTPSVYAVVGEISDDRISGRFAMSMLEDQRVRLVDLQNTEYQAADEQLVVLIGQLMPRIDRLGLVIVISDDEDVLHHIPSLIREGYEVLLIYRSDSGVGRVWADEANYSVTWEGLFETEVVIVRGNPRW